MARSNSTLYDIATSIEEMHGRLTNLIDVSLDQAGSTSPKHVDRVLTLLQVMKTNIEGLAAVRDAAYALSHAEKAPAGSFKDGAAACMAALRRAETIAEHNPEGDYFEERDEAMAEIMRAAGGMPHHAAGALTVLAEYFVGCCQGGQYDPASWKPEALMTDEERTAQRKATNTACV